MNPNTDAELIAYNLGQQLAESDGPVLFGELPEYFDHTIALHPQRQQARDILGPELFWSWADRGYAARKSATPDA
jgi:hypothetical protein